MGVLVTGWWSFEELGEEAELGFIPCILTFVSTLTHCVTCGHPLALSVPQIPHLALTLPT